VLRGYPLKRCEGCGLQTLDPQPDDETLSQIYRQEYYDAWGIQDDEATTRDMKRATFERLIRPIRTGLGEKPRLLDCGAATGYLMEVAAEAGMEPYGVELSEFGAGRIAEKFGPERVFCGPFEESSFEGVDREFFDVITMIDFIEHVRDPAAILAKAHRLLRPGGRILMLTPNAASLSRRLMGPRWLHYKVEHLFYFTPTGLSRCLERSGFTRTRVSAAWKMMNIHYVAHQLARYPHPVLTPIITTFHRLGTAGLRRAKFRITFGEMRAEGIKPTPGMVSS
jgi:2-polyprenyl-3-methyl-5-hydroxy-6-metoxy-1,4-benzoquinol methylase